MEEKGQCYRNHWVSVHNLEPWEDLAKFVHHAALKCLSARPELGTIGHH